MATESKSRSAPIIGIDLGTTYSSVAVWEHNAAVVLDCEPGKKAMPSVVMFSDDSHSEVPVRVGSDALNASTRRNCKTPLIRDTKRLIGLRFSSSKVQDEIKQQNWPFEVKAGHQDNVVISVVVDGKPKEVTPEEVAAHILKRLKEAAERYLEKKVTKAVITVPANFETRQKESTKDAGRIAGFEEVFLLPEPSAAGLAFGVHRMQDRSSTARNVLIFDFGGGTLDVSVLTVVNDVLDVKSTSGNNHLGGIDFDRRILDYVLEEYKKEHGIDAKKELNSTKRHVLAELQQHCRACKEALSQTTKHDVFMDPFLTDGCLDVQVTRSKFEQVSRDLLDLCLPPVRDALVKSNISMESVDEVLLVGGSSRIPRVRQLLRDFFSGKALSEKVDPDTAVALGAATKAAQQMQSGSSIQNAVKLPVMKTYTVTPQGLGIETLGDVFSIIIPAASAAPVTRTHPYVTVKDNQTSCSICIYEGDHPKASHNEPLGKFDVDGIPPLPAGQGKLTVTMAITDQGLLTVTAKTDGDTKSLEVRAHTTKLSENQIQKLQQELNQK